MMLIINIIPTVHKAEADRNSFASKQTSQLNSCWPN